MTQPQTKWPAATHGLLQSMPAVWSTSMGAERHVQPDDEPQGVERLVTITKGRVWLGGAGCCRDNRAGNSVRCDLGLYVCLFECARL